MEKRLARLNQMWGYLSEEERGVIYNTIMFAKAMQPQPPPVAVRKWIINDDPPPAPIAGYIDWRARFSGAFPAHYPTTQIEAIVIGE